MATLNAAVSVDCLRPGSRGGQARLGFTLAALGVMGVAAVLAGWMPLGLSVAAVFLCAGPHNWIEARYFLARMPARWGRLRGFFLLALGGAAGLTATFALLPRVAAAAGWGESAWATARACWDTALVGWVAALVRFRSRQNPRHDWPWVVPAAFALAAVAWLAPGAWDLGLVYLHPLMALWILDRELRRSRPGWRRGYHVCLAALPAVLAVMWVRLADAPSLPGDDALAARVVRHAGAGVLGGVSTHLLVATHAFLELLHYGVWLVAIPLAGLRAAPWRVGQVPLARRSPGWRTALGLALAAGAVAVVALWAGFWVDYPATRDVYFTVAVFHVLAEVPFLLRAL